MRRFLLLLTAAFVFGGGMARLAAADHDLLLQLADADILHADIPALRRLVHGRPNLVYLIATGRLESALYHADPAVLECLLDAGLNADAQDLAGQTPLFSAMTCRNTPDVKLLLARGADPNCADFTGITPTLLACAIEPPEILDAMIARGARLTARDELANSALHFAVMVRSDPQILQRLLDHGLNVNAVNRNGQTPLMVAAAPPPTDYFAPSSSQNDPVGAKQAAVAWLLDHGADVRLVDHANITTLEYAVNSSDTLLAGRCLASGADPNRKNAAGLTLLDLALLRNSPPAFIQFLAAHGARAPYVDRAGNTHLHMRVAYAWVPAHPPAGSDPAPSHCDPVVPILLKYGAPVDAVNTDGQTPLERACEGTNLDSVRILLDYHADPNHADRSGVRPLDIAVAKRDLDITRLLLDRGADPRRTDAAGDRPLHRLLTASLPGEVRTLLTVPPGGRLNRYQLEVHLLYERQHGLIDLLCWIAALLLFGATAQGLQRLGRRRAEHIRANAEADLPATVWKNADWKTLPEKSQRGRMLAAGRRRAEPWLALPLIATFCAAALVRSNPVLWNTVDTVDLWSIFLPGGLCVLFFGLLILQPRALRAILPPLACAAAAATAGLLGWQAWSLAVDCHFYSLGALVGLLSLLDAAALPAILRIQWTDRSLRALNLPFDPFHLPLNRPDEAEQIESHAGWDERAKT
ncbi:MAG: ankyrin repeat domain-containing protein [Planctomycetota bacterium]